MSLSEPKSNSKKRSKTPDSNLSDKPLISYIYFHKTLNAFTNNFNIICFLFDMLCRSVYTDASNKSFNNSFVSIFKSSYLEGIHEKLLVGQDDLNLIQVALSFFKMKQIELFKLQLSTSYLHQKNAFLKEELLYVHEKLEDRQKIFQTIDKRRKSWLFYYQIRHDAQLSKESSVIGDAIVTTKRKSQVFNQQRFTTDQHLLSLLTPKTKSLYTLCLCYLNQSRLEVASSLCNQHIQEAKLNKTMLSVIDCSLIFFVQSLILMQDTKFKESVVCLNETINIINDNVGNKHPALICVYQQLGRCLVELGSYNKAETSFRTALAICSNRSSINTTNTTSIASTNTTRDSSDGGFVIERINMDTSSITVSYNSLVPDEFTNNYLKIAELQVDLADCLVENNKVKQAAQVCTTNTIITLQRQLSSVDPILIRAQIVLACIAFGQNNAELAKSQLCKLLTTIFKHAGLEPVHKAVQAVAAKCIVPKDTSASLVDISELVLELADYRQIACSLERRVLRVLAQVYKDLGETIASRLLESILNEESNVSQW